MADQDQDQTALFIDGARITIDDLTYREQRDMREFVRNLAPEHDPDQAGEQDVIPALIAVVKRRTDPEFTLEQALDFKPSDLAPPEAVGAAADPTPAGEAKK
jgi:hypothetical protein